MERKKSYLMWTTFAFHGEGSSNVFAFDFYYNLHKEKTTKVSTNFDNYITLFVCLLRLSITWDFLLMYTFICFHRKTPERKSVSQLIKVSYLHTKIEEDQHNLLPFRVHCINSPLQVKSDSSTPCADVCSSVVVLEESSSEEQSWVSGKALSQGLIAALFLASFGSLVLKAASPLNATFTPKKT